MPTATDSQACKFNEWKLEVISCTPRRRFNVGDGEFSKLQIEPGSICVIGGEGGLGKTALIMQLAYSAIELDESVKVLVCNTEMDADRLWERQLARLAMVPYERLRDPNLDAHDRMRLNNSMMRLEEWQSRMLILDGLGRQVREVQDEARRFGADIIVIDYIQEMLTDGGHESEKSRIDKVMSVLRAVASEKRAVIALSSIVQPDGDGRKQSGSKLRFLGSSSIRYKANSAYFMTGITGKPNCFKLKHDKARDGRLGQDLFLFYDSPLQTFRGLPVDRGPSAGDKQDAPVQNRGRSSKPKAAKPKSLPPKSAGNLNDAIMEQNGLTGVKGNANG